MKKKPRKQYLLTAEIQIMYCILVITGDTSKHSPLCFLISCKILQVKCITKLYSILQVTKINIKTKTNYIFSVHFIPLYL